MSSHFEGNLPIVVEVDLSPLYVIIVKVTVYLIKNPNTDLCSSYIYIFSLAILATKICVPKITG